MTVDWSVLESQIGYVFKDRDYLLQACSHRSAPGAHNERMEYLGDAILGAVLAAALYARYPDAAEGQLTRWRAFLVNGKQLATMASGLSLMDFIILGAGERRSGGATRESILAGTFEALIGAIYLDSDWSAVSACILNWYVDLLQPSGLDSMVLDAKTRLQQWLQARQFPLPEYEVTAVGLAHEQEFTAVCRVAGFDCETTGQGWSQRAAQQVSAELFLQEVLKDES